MDLGLRGDGYNNILADDVPDVHTSPIYVEKSAGYETVITTRAKKLRTGNIDQTSFVKFPSPAKIPVIRGIPRSNRVITREFTT